MIGNGVATVVVARWEKEVDGRDAAKEFGGGVGRVHLKVGRYGVGWRNVSTL